MVAIVVLAQLVSCTYDRAVSDPKPPDASFGNDTVVITLGFKLFVNSDIRALEIRAFANSVLQTTEPEPETIAHIIEN